MKIAIVEYSVEIPFTKDVKNRLKTCDQADIENCLRELCYKDERPYSQRYATLEEAKRCYRSSIDFNCFKTTGGETYMYISCTEIVQNEAGTIKHMYRDCLADMQVDYLRKKLREVY